MIEQDDRVKKANGVILAAKCRAIRNAQIAEKRVSYYHLQPTSNKLHEMINMNLVNRKAAARRR